jgi:hypothetical protein
MLNVIENDHPSSASRTWVRRTTSPHIATFWSINTEPLLRMEAIPNALLYNFFVSW